MDIKLFHATQQKESAVDAVVNRFRELILQKKLKPGDRLPNEGALAGAMGVSRGPVREAMKILSALGVVEIRQGDGTYMSADFSRSILDPFLLKLMMNDYDTRQLAEFRSMIELDVARAAVKNRTAESYIGIREAVKHMEQALEDRAAHNERYLAELDLEFHRALGRAAGNVLIEQLYNYIMFFFLPSIQETYRKPGNLRAALGYHRAILAALEGGGEQELLDAMERSIAGWIKEDDRG